MKKLVILLVLGPALLVGFLFGYVLYQGPRMKVQHHIRDFQMSLPNIPAGTVAARPPERMPSSGQAPQAPPTAQTPKPLPKTADNLARGRVYYHYYCVFCHGDLGAGDGPVGESYTPKPADLRAVKSAVRGDADLLRAMLTGLGHEPVLERIVPPEHRPYLVLFLRSLEGAREG